MTNQSNQPHGAETNNPLMARDFLLNTASLRQSPEMLLRAHMLAFAWENVPRRHLVTVQAVANNFINQWRERRKQDDGDELYHRNRIIARFETTCKRAGLAI